MEQIYAKYPSLGPSPAQRRADKLRDIADAIEENESDRIVSDFFREEAIAARRCEAAISAGHVSP